MYPLTATYYDPEEKIWSGPQRKDLYNKDITLGEVIFDVLSKWPEKTIQIHDVSGEKLTGQQLLDHSRILSKNLMKLGLRKGDVIGLVASNWTHVTTLMLSSFLCGTPVNALYPGFDKDNVSMVYKVTQPKILFCDAENYKTALQVNDQLKLNAPVFVMNDNDVVEGVGHIKDLLKDENDGSDNKYLRFPCKDLSGDDTAMLLCSSGTTGAPKGVKCSHRALLNQIVFLTLKPTSVTFTFSAMYWASGLWTLVASLITGTLRIMTTRPYTPEYFLQLVDQYKITHVLSNNQYMAELSLYEDVPKIQKCLASIDTILVGGAKVLLSLQEKMNDILSINPKRPGFAVAYGMSELSGMLTINGGYVSDRLIGAEGKMLANKKARILDKQGQPLGPNEHGEICIYSPYTWFGYHNNEEATRKAMRDNWLYTGDIGYFDEEGFLHVCARDNDVFKSRNFQIYPQLIEEVISRLNGISEVCVCGIPDTIATHLTACAVVRASTEEGKKLTTKEIEDQVKANMGSMYHLSGGVYFVDAIPKTGSGKVQRAKVLELVMKMKEGKEKNTRGI
ncbi:luciferin 4-monooxygenase-like [Musca vetustissima]|uniref:luciferin 4-monooxygenase-like n=1 Tax=Musca vetustissima TaxID=27455 RepID=UPI002AB6A39D|nr:luciferin 4-monooxygenase-like [Musca vetustissima]